ncbi:MAG: type II secretion system F family protein [Thermoanaerobaculia bacterium]
MIYLVVLLAGLSVTLLTVGVASAVMGGTQGRVVRQRLAGLQGGGAWGDADARRRRLKRRERIETLLSGLGERVSRKRVRQPLLRRQLRQAGYRSPKAPALFMAIRLLLAVGLYAIAAFFVSFTEVEASTRLLILVMGGLLGWMLPFLVLKRKIRERARALQRGLADAVDLLVVCVEAGLGLNQALIRVAEEMERVSPEISEELETVVLEMRAGTPREVALQNLAERTALQDIRSWVGMMVQTERFGTSIADSLRVHSDSMRTKRRQRAEEAAAKLTVKLLIPLVVFVFPALLVVIFGPAVLLLKEFMGS